ncbi:MAG: DNA helicase II, partial [Gammaproteobacteria bacterium]|nr:DNA helicase II [Gammaproteobacteria bacterium]
MKNQQNILKNLNPAQLQAVTSNANSLLVLAGAGSGKTRVLTHRIAWLMQEKQVSQYALFAVTFTNKAANEMKTRVSSLIDQPIDAMWIGTFHGLAHRFLRLHWKAANLEQAFQIIDSEDQLRLIRRLLKALNVDEEKWQPKAVQNYINSKKEAGLRSQDVQIPEYNLAERQLLELYSAYETACTKSNLVDFSELLLRTYETLKNDVELQKHYQQRFEHLLVDEFQDTNTIQYDLLSMLAGGQNNIMFVGDDDQSIYSWRGAKIENIFRVQKDFPSTELIRLEQNYRSTNNILNTANALINHNKGRLGKTLWTDQGDGEPVSVYAAYNDRDEAYFVVNRALDWAKQNRLSDCAILYRSNAQSRVIEEVLLQLNVPYRVFGGMRFFERAEIKDALAYLRLLVNADDDAAFERVINVPTRGIGDRTLTILREKSRNEDTSLWVALQNVVKENQLPARATTALFSFMNLIEELAATVTTDTLYEVADAVLQKTALLEHFGKEKGEKGQVRVENLQELLSSVRQFEMEADKDQSAIISFLSHAALEAGENQADATTDAIQLMTLHSAKGLEFPVVFLTGLEEQLFPHQMSFEDPHRLEEERRLCYVGMTRAQRKLFLTHAQARRLHGHESIQRPSRFLQEIPSELLLEIRKTTRVSKPLTTKTTSRPQTHQAAWMKQQANMLGIKLGQRVSHPKFGEGVVLEIEGAGDQAHIQVRFKSCGIKWLVAK